MLRPVPLGLTSFPHPSKSRRQSTKKDGDPTVHGKIYGSVDPKGKRLSLIPSSYTRDGPRKSGKGSIFVLGCQVVLPIRPPLRGTGRS